MSEKALQEALQTTLRTLPGWNSQVTVVINDWRIMDGSLENAPYALIETADSVTSQSVKFSLIATSSSTAWRRFRI